MPAKDSFRRIHAVVSRIPRGRVATYGQIASLAGLPRRARLVGTALRSLPPHSDVPWHRVVNAKGRVSPRAHALGVEELQEQLLRGERVLSSGGSVPLTLFQWQPGARTATAVKPKPRSRR